jgi:hypothetical protein
LEFSTKKVLRFFGNLYQKNVLKKRRNLRILRFANEIMKLKSARKRRILIILRFANEIMKLKSARKRRILRILRFANEIMKLKSARKRRILRIFRLQMKLWNWNVSFWETSLPESGEFWEFSAVEFLFKFCKWNYVIEMFLIMVFHMRYRHSVQVLKIKILNSNVSQYLVCCFTCSRYILFNFRERISENQMFLNNIFLRDLVILCSTLENAILKLKFSQ